MEEIRQKSYIQKKEKGSGEYENLYLEGIELLQKLSGAKWTDYNAHDPGITIFENLAYTLTSLSYKTDLPIKDVLTESKGDVLKSGDNGFFIPDEILTTNPIVFEDLRKVLFDQVKNVKNVWIELYDQLERGTFNSIVKNNIKGLYHIYVEVYRYKEFGDEWKTEETRIINDVSKLFHAQRNLCEDLFKVTVYVPLEFKMELSLSLDEKMIGEEVFAEAYFQVRDYLSPEIHFNSLNDLQQNDKNINDIFDGPTLENGFITNSELKKRRNTIYKSEIVRLISKIDGVVSVDHFELYIENPNSNPQTFIRIKEKWILQSLYCSALKLPEDSDSLTYWMSGVKLKPDIKEMQKQFSYLEAMHFGLFKSVSQSDNSIGIPPGEKLDISSYYPLRNQFPVVYGVGDYGLPDGLPSKRYAQVKQLNAYLLPFDQLMQNFLSQLTNIYTLYDPGSNDIQSYFYRELDDMSSLLDLISPNRDTRPEEALNSWKVVLDGLNKSKDTKALKRLSDVADNLLSRYAEEFPTHALKKINTTCYGRNFTDQSFETNMLYWKRKLISNYARLSYNRTRSFNYTNEPNTKGEESESIFSNNNTPPIVEKISILLGIKYPLQRMISRAMKKEGIELLPGRSSSDQFSADFQNDSYRPKDSFYFPGNFRNVVDSTLKYGILSDNYSIESGIIDGERKFFVTLKGPDNITRKIYEAGSQEEAGAAKEYAHHYLQQINQQSEGVHLIEHILLAPPPDEPYYGFTFKLQSAGNEILEFEHGTLQSNMRRNISLNKLLEIQKRKSNKGEKDKMAFSISGESNNFRIEIMVANSSLVLARSINVFETEDAARKSIDSILKWRENNKESSPIFDINCLAYYGDDKVNETFFTFRMSFILPSWPVRFQNESFRTQFNNIVYEHAPAHIAYHAFWLNYYNMSSFEESYFEWLQLLPKADDWKKRMDLAFTLISLLKSFNNNEL